MEFETSRIIPADHPALAGHFPGNPLVPGVVILDAVIAAVTERWPGCRVTGVSSAKFMSPLRPDQRLTIKAARSGETAVRFACDHDGRPTAQGVLTITGG